MALLKPTIQLCVASWVLLATQGVFAAPSTEASRDATLARRTSIRRYTGARRDLDGIERHAHIQAIVRRSRVVDACWNAALQRDPAHVTERVVVRLEVDSWGRAIPAIDGAHDPRLSDCLRVRLAAQNFGAGEPAEVEVAFGLVRGD